MPPPTQRWMRPSAMAKVRIVSARSRSPFGQTVPSAPIDAPRPTGSRAAMWSIAAIFGAPVTEPPGKSRRQQLGQADPSRRSPSTRRRYGRRPRSRAGHELGPADDPGLAHAREVVALEVDDHHVLGGVLVRSGELERLAERARALDRLRPDPRPAPREEELGRGRNHRPALAGERSRLERPQRGQRRGQAGRIAAEGRGEMLDQVHLVDVSGRNRLPHRLDGGHVGRLVPRPLPVADVVRACPRQRLVRGSHVHRRKRQRARLRRARDLRPAETPTRARSRGRGRPRARPRRLRRTPRRAARVRPPRWSAERSRNER